MVTKSKSKVQAVYSPEQLLGNAQFLTECLNELTANDTARIKRAEATLKPFTKNADCIPALLNQIRDVKDETVQLQAALALKKKHTNIIQKAM